LEKFEDSVKKAIEKLNNLKKWVYYEW
jgi:hypothetical protein